MLSATPSTTPPPDPSEAIADKAFEQVTAALAASFPSYKLRPRQVHDVDWDELSDPEDDVPHFVAQVDPLVALRSLLSTSVPTWFTRLPPPTPLQAELPVIPSTSKAVVPAPASTKKRTTDAPPRTKPRKRLGQREKAELRASASAANSPANGSPQPEERMQVDRVEEEVDELLGSTQLHLGGQAEDKSAEPPAAEEEEEVDELLGATQMYGKEEDEAAAALSLPDLYASAMKSAEPAKLAEQEVEQIEIDSDSDEEKSASTHQKVPAEVIVVDDSASSSSSEEGGSEREDGTKSVETETDATGKTDDGPHDAKSPPPPSPRRYPVRQTVLESPNGKLSAKKLPSSARSPIRSPSPPKVNLASTSPRLDHVTPAVTATSQVKAALRSPIGLQLNLSKSVTSTSSEEDEAELQLSLATHASPVRKSAPMPQSPNLSAKSTVEGSPSHHSGDADPEEGEPATEDDAEGLEQPSSAQKQRDTDDVARIGASDEEDDSESDSSSSASSDEDAPISKTRGGRRSLGEIMRSSLGSANGKRKGRASMPASFKLSGSGRSQVLDRDEDSEFLGKLMAGSLPRSASRSQLLASESEEDDSDDRFSEVNSRSASPELRRKKPVKVTRGSDEESGPEEAGLLPATQPVAEAVAPKADLEAEPDYVRQETPTVAQPVAGPSPTRQSQRASLSVLASVASSYAGSESYVPDQLARLRSPVEESQFVPLVKATPLFLEASQTQNAQDDSQALLEVPDVIEGELSRSKAGRRTEQLRRESRRRSTWAQPSWNQKRKPN